jgi:hypothetical protein
MIAPAKMTISAIRVHYGGERLHREPPTMQFDDIRLLFCH